MGKEVEEVATKAGATRAWPCNPTWRELDTGDTGAMRKSVLTPTPTPTRTPSHRPRGRNTGRNAQNLEQAVATRPHKEMGSRRRPRKRKDMNSTHWDPATSHPAGRKHTLPGAHRHGATLTLTLAV